MPLLTELGWRTGHGLAINMSLLTELGAFDRISFISTNAALRPNLPPSLTHYN
jgi:hypothetical protein